MRISIVPIALLLLACSTTPAEPEGLAVGTDVEVVLADEILQNFGDPNLRTVEFDAALPEAALWDRITLRYELSCPSGGCDPWDRWGNLELLDGDEAMEIARVITPYRVGGVWDIDLTHLATELVGERRFRSTIDTWVGGGEGWLLSATLIYQGGDSARRPIKVQKVFNNWVVYGDPARPVSEQLPALELEVPDGAGKLELRALVTGHGQGNEGNCAEFCRKTHSLTAKDRPEYWENWRDDCDQNPIDNQSGSWTYARAGWCPGADVLPQVFEWRVDGEERVSVSWAPEEYINRCGGSAECSNCPAGFPGCEYDGGAHTEPRWSVGVVAVFY